MWKSKSRPCTHCTSRPNRAQARVSQEREVGVDEFFDFHQRHQLSTQRPSSAPANESLSADHTLMVTTTSTELLQSTRMRALGPRRYRESKLYRTSDLKPSSTAGSSGGCNLQRALGPHAYRGTLYRTGRVRSERGWVAVESTSSPPSTCTERTLLDLGISDEAGEGGALALGGA